MWFGREIVVAGLPPLGCLVKVGDRGGVFTIYYDVFETSPTFLPCQWKFRSLFTIFVIVIIKLVFRCSSNNTKKIFLTKFPIYYFCQITAWTELSLCHRLWFSNFNIFASSGCKDIGIIVSLWKRLNSFGRDQLS